MYMAGRWRTGSSPLRARIWAAVYLLRLVAVGDKKFWRLSLLGFAEAGAASRRIYEPEITGCKKGAESPSRRIKYQMPHQLADYNLAACLFASRSVFSAARSDLRRR